MRPNTKKQANLSIQSGFHHHDMPSEQELLTLLLKSHGTRPKSHSLNLDTYAMVLAPNPFRAMQNALICFVAIISRTVIRLGVSPEKSFSLSDYFVYSVEEKHTRKELDDLIEEILTSYSDLLQADQVSVYSKKIAKAIRYIQEHVYDSCRVEDIATHLTINPRYFTKLFKAETGISPSVYIKQKKLEEARQLLSQHDMSVREVSEMLCFCNPSYFASEFRKAFNVSPHIVRDSVMD